MYTLSARQAAAAAEILHLDDGAVRVRKEETRGEENAKTVSLENWLGSIKGIEKTLKMIVIIKNFIIKFNLKQFSR